MNRKIEFIKRARKVKVILIDVDGVLTNGSIILSEKVGEIKIFDTKDGQGITLLKKQGYTIIFVSGRDSAVLRKRAEELGIFEIYTGVTDKGRFYEELKSRYAFKDEQVMAIGDDIQDIPLLSSVGLPVCVSDACNEVKSIALYVTQKPGGKGALREIADLLLMVRG